MLTGFCCSWSSRYEWKGKIEEDSEVLLVSAL